MGGFANYLQKFYAMRSYTSTGCPCMLDDSCAGPVKEDCHEGLGLEPAEQTAIRVFGSLPWNYKIYYGIMSDCLPIWGSHRRSYIALAGLLGTFAFIGLGLQGDAGNGASKDVVKYLFLLSSLSTAFCDVCTDALVAANAKMESEAGAGNLQSLCWLALGVGGMLSNLFAGTFYGMFASTQVPFFCCALIPFTRLFLAYRLKEPGPPGKIALSEISSRAKKLVRTLGHPGINRPIAFIFLSWATIPNLLDQQNNFLVSGDVKGWTATYPNGADALATDFGFQPGSRINGSTDLSYDFAGFDCEWFADNDAGCAGAWMPEVQAADATPIANTPHNLAVPNGWQRARPTAACELSSSGSFVAAVEACLDAVGADALPCDGVKLGKESTECNCLSAGCSYFAADSSDKCLALGPAIAGLSGDALTIACPMIAGTASTGLSGGDRGRRERCRLKLAEIAANPAAGDMRVLDICPLECASVNAADDAASAIDMCDVVGGGGSSCAAAVLAQAWNSCPETCSSCESTKRGCIRVSDNFLAWIQIVSYFGLLIGTAVYSNYFKASKYRKLLLFSQLLLTFFSVVDFLLVTFIDGDTKTVLGIDGRAFAIFGEASQDVMIQIKLMPMLVLAAQICPSNIEGTLFAFIMGMSNMGDAFAAEFASWLTLTLGITSSDFSGMPAAQGLRILFKLSPIGLLWLIPDENPKDVVAMIDAELQSEEKEELELSSISDGEGAKKGGASQGWDLSGWPMLLLLMPPFGFLQLAQPIKNLFEWDLPFLAVPVLLLIAIPAYQHFIQEQGAGWHASSKGPGGEEGLAEGLTEGMAEEPDKPPPDVTAL